MLHVHTGLKIRHEQKLEEIQSSVGLFKTNDHLIKVYVQGAEKNYLCPVLLYI